MGLTPIDEFAQANAGPWDPPNYSTSLDDCVALASGIGRGDNGMDGPMPSSVTVIHGPAVDDLNALSGEQARYSQALRDTTFQHDGVAFSQDTVGRPGDMAL
ncbi:hypothetical protein [Mycobacterium sp.]|uniref:hypothetical protein n=1 Tax=Mycobacterium sp. TaxID=1785 RepID=UPI003F9BAD0E